MYLVVTDAALGAVVVAPACAEVLDDRTRAVIEGADFRWCSDIEAFTQPGQDRDVAARIALRLVQLGHDVLAC
ncbi:hypothetical protein ACWD4T_31480 [Streptomyces umbrinus]